MSVVYKYSMLVAMSIHRIAFCTAWPGNFRRLLGAKKSNKWLIFCMSHKMKKKSARGHTSSCPHHLSGGDQKWWGMKWVLRDTYSGLSRGHVIGVPGTESRLPAHLCPYPCPWSLFQLLRHCRPRHCRTRNGLKPWQTKLWINLARRGASRHSSKNDTGCLRSLTLSWRARSAVSGALRKT